MSDSEEDFFLATQLPPKSRKKRVVSDISSKLSVVEYFFLVTFNWDLMVGNPFQINVREVLTEFPDEWIKGALVKSNRVEKIKINSFGGGQYSLFCKVEKGIFL